MGRQRDLPDFLSLRPDYLWLPRQLRVAVRFWSQPLYDRKHIAGTGSGFVRRVHKVSKRIRCSKDDARRPVSRVLSAPQVALECGTTIPLGHASRRASRDQPGRRGGKPLCLAAPPPLFGLAPGGVYPAAPVARGAVRSCRTVSPLPAGRLAALARAVCFLWHFPWGRPRRPLAGTVFPWSPDFPLTPRGISGRPAVWRGTSVRRSARKQGSTRRSPRTTEGH
jgi:hypothetical protein